jgi:hypothetical protein
MRGLSFVPLVFAFAVAGSVGLGAQIAVFDGATTARNAATAAIKEFLLQVQRDQHSQLRRMAARLSTLTSLAKYVLQDVPRWRTHGGEEFLFTAGYNNALIFGDRSGTAYLDLTDPLVAVVTRLDSLPGAARRAMLAQLATVDLTDAAAIAATNDTGQVRFNGRKKELPAIDALERDVIDPSDQQSTTAVLDKISGGVLIGARQRQARIQLLEGVVEQLLDDSKRDRDTETTALNMQLVTWREGRAANDAFVRGSGDALRTWRQP